MPAKNSIAVMQEAKVAGILHEIFKLFFIASEYASRVIKIVTRTSDTEWSADFFLTITAVSLYIIH